MCEKKKIVGVRSFGEQSVRERFLCPISCDVMVNPVVELSQIREWVRREGTSPRSPKYLRTVRGVRGVLGVLGIYGLKGLLGPRGPSVNSEDY